MPIVVNEHFNAYQAARVWSEVLAETNIARYTILNGSTVVWPVSAIQPGAGVTNRNVNPPVGVPVIARPASDPAIRYDPRVELTPYSQLQNGQQVGTLYIADVFRDSIDAGPTAPRCQHDFRLAPMARAVGATASVPNLVLPDLKPWGFTMFPSVSPPLPGDNYCANPWYNNLDATYGKVRR